MTRVKKEGTALITVDVQNYVLHENGFGADWGILQHAKEKNMIENTKKAIEKARAAGIPVVHTIMNMRLEVLPDMGLWKAAKHMEFATTKPEKREFEFGIVEELTPQPEDIVVIKYNTLDAFHNTDLDQILKGLKCDTLLFTGVATNLCLEITFRSAFNRGYECVVLSDCTASINEEFQKFAVEGIFPMFGEVCTVDELEIVS